MSTDCITDKHAKPDVSLASIKIAHAARYLAGAAVVSDDIENWRLTEAITQLKEIAALLGYELVKPGTPDLLAALKEATRCLAWHEEKHGVGMDRKAVQNAFAAIAKAEGRA